MSTTYCSFTRFPNWLFTYGTFDLIDEFDWFFQKMCKLQSEPKIQEYRNSQCLQFWILESGTLRCESDEEEILHKEDVEFTGQRLKIYVGENSNGKMVAYLPSEH